MNLLKGELEEIVKFHLSRYREYVTISAISVLYSKSSMNFALGETSFNLRVELLLMVLLNDYQHYHQISSPRARFRLLDITLSRTFPSFQKEESLKWSNPLTFS